jgi:hypothetical protein
VARHDAREALTVIVALRRLWWATLPYYGWTGGSIGERVDAILCGARPCPLWAHPLSWLHIAIDKTVFRHRDVFGPRSNAWMRRPVVGSTRPEAWL